MGVGLSNYPPGVTGLEPDISGIAFVDPHAPYWAGENVEKRGTFAVFFADDEDHFFEGIPTMPAAERLAGLLNRHYSLRHEDADAAGQCRVCGDYHGDPPWADNPTEGE